MSRQGLYRKLIDFYHERKTRKTIERSGVFDQDWYLDQNPDVKTKGIDPIVHYLREGALEGRDPCRNFSTSGYLRSNPDVAESGINPLFHYIMYGASEGRSMGRAECLGYPEAHGGGGRGISPSPRKDLFVHPQKERISDRYKIKFEILDQFQLKGWCVDNRSKHLNVKFTLFIDDRPFGEYIADRSRQDLKRKGLSAGGGGFQIDSPFRFMDNGEYLLHAEFKDGSCSEKVKFEAKDKYPAKFIDPDNYMTNGVSVIIPVHNAFSETKKCINRLLQWTPEFAEIIIINDASTDSRVEQFLCSYADSARVRIMHNEVNLGFTRTVNLGIDAAGRNDVVLLNSDAYVTPRWLEGMLMAAASSSRIATVTAMSDRAGAFSAPEMGNENELPEGVDEITFAKAFRRLSVGTYPEVPTGNGFCMLIRRACIDEIGSLDAELFPRGYGEENHFCMRAFHAGWKNIIDDRTYVYHERTSSFVGEKTILIENAENVIGALFPEYKSLTPVFNQDVKMRLARYSGKIAHDRCATQEFNLPRIMFVTSTKTGGTPLTNMDLMSGLEGDVDTWLFRCDRSLMELIHFKDGYGKLVRTHRLEKLIEPISHFSEEYDRVIFNWMFEFDIDIVHIRHFAWHSLSLPKVARKLGLKVVFSFHDYYTISPTVKLLDDCNVFLGRSFKEGFRVTPLWPDVPMPAPENAWLDRWRSKFSDALLNCDALVTTSKYARSIFLETFSGLKQDQFFVVQHGRDFSEFNKIREYPKRGEPVRILFPGNINFEKGLHVIQELARFDINDRLEFHVVGKIAGEVDCKKIIQHGVYERSNFLAAFKKCKPHIGGVFSIWDETWCHTLTEMWAAGVPVIVFDFPTVAARVRESGAGWVLDHEDIKHLYVEILRIAFDSEEQLRADRALKNWQSGAGIENTTRMMAAKYYEIYKQLLTDGYASISKARNFRVGVVCPSDRSLAKAAASTYIRIWERTKNYLERDIVYVRMLPETFRAVVKSGEIDAAIIQRTAIPAALTHDVVSELKANSIPFIYDIDDDLIGHSVQPDSEYREYQKPIEILLGGADLVTVSTDALKDKYADIAKNIAVVPNYLSDRLWLTSPLKRKDDRMVRALYMGTFTHDLDLEYLLPVFDKISEEWKNFRLMLVGVTKNIGRFKEMSWIECINVPEYAKAYDRFVPWLREISSRCDFAIAPLADNQFNRYKSNLKNLEYAALGLPVIASDFPQYRMDSPALILASSQEQEWRIALEKQIGLGLRCVETEKMQRSWVLSSHMLKPKLREYDENIILMLNKKMCETENLSENIKNEPEQEVDLSFKMKKNRRRAAKRKNASLL